MISTATSLRDHLLVIEQVRDVSHLFVFGAQIALEAFLRLNFSGDALRDLECRRIPGLRLFQDCW